MAAMSLFEAILYLYFGADLAAGLVKAPPRDLASLLSPRAALAEMKAPADEDSLLALLGGAAGVKDLAKMTRDLGSDAYKDRKRAAAALLSAGPAALPYLKKAGGSDDPEVRLTARELMAKLEKRGGREGQTDRAYAKRLFAIRALQQMKSRKAIPALRRLCKDADATLADAARRALADLEGGKPTRPSGLETLKEVRRRLPADIAAVAFADLTRNAGWASLRERVDASPKTPGFPSLKPALEKAEREVLGLVSRAGNIRIDSVTVTLSKSASLRSATMIWVFKGLCDPDRLRPEIKRAFPRRYRSSGHMLFADSRRRRYVCVVDSHTAVYVQSSNRREARQWMDVFVFRLTGKPEQAAPGFAKRAIESLAKRPARVVAGAVFDEQARREWRETQERATETWKTAPKEQDPEFGMAMARALGSLANITGFSARMDLKGEVSVEARCPDGDKAGLTAAALAKLSDLFRKRIARQVSNFPRPAQLATEALGKQSRLWRATAAKALVNARVAANRLRDLGLAFFIRFPLPRFDGPRPLGNRAF